jgi:heme/copper-type cytochrome/quinol oxidase subunit 1
MPSGNMPKFKIRPYNLLVIGSIAVFFAGQPQFGFPIDLFLCNTYFILEISFLTWLFIFTMLVCWVIYSFTKRFVLSGFLVWAHILLTVILSTAILMSPYFFQFSDVGVAGAPRRYFDYGSFSNYQILGNMALVTSIMVILLLLAQLVFIFNITPGLFTTWWAGKNIARPPK